METSLIGPARLVIAPTTFKISIALQRVLPLILLTSSSVHAQQIVFQQMSSEMPLTESANHVLAPVRLA